MKIGSTLPSPVAVASLASAAVFSTASGKSLGLVAALSNFPALYLLLLANVVSSPAFSSFAHLCSSNLLGLFQLVSLAFFVDLLSAK